MILLKLRKQFQCRACDGRATYSLLAASSAANTFQCFAVSDCEQIPMHFNASQRTASRFQYIAVTDREHISKQWDWPPRLLVLGWLESKNGEKTFKV